MSSRNTAPARAAAKVGYPVSNRGAFSNVKSAIRSNVRLADQVGWRSLKADRWDGPAAYKSDIYPDRWVPEQARPEVMSRTRLRIIPKSSAARHNTKLSWRKGINVKEPILLTIRPKKVEEGTKQKPKEAAIRSLKRGLPEDVEEMITSKVTKTEDIAIENTDFVYDGLVDVRDLSQETRGSNLRSLTNYRNTNTIQHTTTSSISRLLPQGPSIFPTSHTWKKTTQEVAEFSVRSGTMTTLENVRQHLQTRVRLLQQDCEDLYDRWELDDELKEDQTMGILTRLSGNLGKAERALYEAMKDVERLLCS